MVAVLGLGGCLLAVARYGDRSTLAPVLVLGLCLTGVAAAVVAADGPPPEGFGRSVRGGGDAGGGFDGSGAGGDCGAGGGDCG